VDGGVGRRGDALRGQVDVGARQHLAARGVERLLRARLEIHLGLLGLLDDQLLVDQLLEHLAAGLFLLLGTQAALALQLVVDLVHRDLGAVHPRRALRGVLLVAGAGRQQQHRADRGGRPGGGTHRRFVVRHESHIPLRPVPVRVAAQARPMGW